MTTVNEKQIDMNLITNALRQGAQALKDIINAAGNGEPYSPEELEGSFSADYDLMVEALQEIGATEIC